MTHRTQEVRTDDHEEYPLEMTRPCILRSVTSTSMHYCTTERELCVWEREQRTRNRSFAPRTIDWAKSSATTSTGWTTQQEIALSRLLIPLNTQVFIFTNTDQLCGTTALHWTELHQVMLIWWRGPISTIKSDNTCEEEFSNERLKYVYSSVIWGL